MLAQRYAEAFRKVYGAYFLTARPGAEVNHWLNAPILDRPGMAMRDTLLEALNGAGFMARPLWTPMDSGQCMRPAPTTPCGSPRRWKPA